VFRTFSASLLNSCVYLYDAVGVLSVFWDENTPKYTYPYLPVVFSGFGGSCLRVSLNVRVNASAADDSMHELFKRKRPFDS